MSYIPYIPYWNYTITIPPEFYLPLKDCESSDEDTDDETVDIKVDKIEDKPEDDKTEKDKTEEDDKTKKLETVDTTRDSIVDSS